MYCVYCCVHLLAETVSFSLESQRWHYISTDVTTWSQGASVANVMQTQNLSSHFNSDSNKKIYFKIVRGIQWGFLNLKEINTKNSSHLIVFKALWRVNGHNWHFTESISLVQSNCLIVVLNWNITEPNKINYYLYIYFFNYLLASWTII